jgi:adenylate cyclase
LTPTAQRRLAAILVADVAGYSRMMGQDEEGTLAALSGYRSELIDPCIAAHRGRIVKTTGDGLLAEFASVVDAVRCAVAFQERMQDRSTDMPEDRRIQFRIGINLGDVIVQDDDIFGDGVNIAARLESLADPGGIVVSGKVHEEVRGKVNLDFDDLGLQLVKNIREPVKALRVRAPGRTAITATALRSLPDKPSIAVLPLTNMSGDPGQEYFADGISEDIITKLSRFHWFFVIARNSSFTYKGGAVDIKRVARELGVQYVLEGSVRKAANRVRITAQLIDAATGRHVWAERYDRNLEDIFTVQDEISEAIATTVAPAFISVEAQRAGRKAPENLDAWDYAMRGNWYLTRRGRNDIAEARRLFESSLQIDPGNTTALAGLAFALCWVNIYGWEKDRDAVLAQAYDTARRAVDLDQNDAWAHAILGWVRFSARELDAAIAECRLALELNPSLALAESVLAIAHSWRGEHDDAIRHAEMAQQLSPRDPVQSMWSFARTCAEFGAGHYAQSAEWARMTVDAMPDFPGAWRYLAAGLGQLDRSEEARVAIQQLLRVMPHDNLRMVREVLPSVRPERMAQFLDGLRKAGLPE